MDFGATPKTFATGAVPATVRTDISVQNGATPVELPPEKTVRSIAAGEPVQLDIRARAEERRSDAQRRQSAQDETAQQRRFDEQRRQQDLRDVIERRLEVDPKTRSIVLRKTDRETGEVIDQYPDETLLKLRALSRELIERDRGSVAAAQSHEVERIA
jgi:flagellar protein FlaG